MAVPGGSVGRDRSLSLVEYAYVRIRDGIVRAVYPQDHPLRPTAIAAELDISVIPVREAFRRLEAERLVVVEPNRGARVTTMSTEDLTDIYATRKLLEADALRRSAPHLTASDLVELRANLCEMARAYDRDDTAVAMHSHRQFHDKLYARADSPRILEFIDTLLSASDRYLWLSPQILDEDNFRDEHEAVLLAVESGHIESAVSALELHHDLALERIRHVDWAQARPHPPHSAAVSH